MQLCAIKCLIWTDIVTFWVHETTLLFFPPLLLLILFSIFLQTHTLNRCLVQLKKKHLWLRVRDILKHFQLHLFVIIMKKQKKTVRSIIQVFSVNLWRRDMPFNKHMRIAWKDGHNNAVIMLNGAESWEVKFCWG